MKKKAQDKIEKRNQLNIKPNPSWWGLVSGACTEFGLTYQPGVIAREILEHYTQAWIEAERSKAQTTKHQTSKAAAVSANCKQ